EELLATELKGGPRGSSQATAGTAQAGASPYAGAPTESKERESERSLSPFERDTLRKLRAAETAGPSSRAPQPPATNSGMQDAASGPLREQAATEGDITQRAVEQ